MKIKPRSIQADWQVSQDVPSPFEPVKFLETNYAPYFNPEHYAEYINGAARRNRPVQAIHSYDEHYRMPGIFTEAEIIDGQLWLTFEPQKLGGKYWVSFTTP